MSEVKSVDNNPYKWQSVCLYEGCTQNPPQKKFYAKLVIIIWKTIQIHDWNAYA